MEVLRGSIFLLVIFELAARLGGRLAPNHSLAHRWSQGLAATMAVFSGGALLLSVFGGLLPWVTQGLTCLGLPLLLRSRAWSDLQRLGRLWGGFIAFMVLLATVPNTHWDVQVYHYTLPRLYLEQGRVHWTGTGIYDSLVSLSHPLHAWAMGCAGEMGANLLGLAFLMMLTTSLVAVTDACGVAGSAPVVVALVASSPLLLRQADGGLTDLPAAAYLAAMMASPGSRGGWMWGLMAILTRLNAGLGVVLWHMATGRWRILGWLLMAGVIPWVLTNVAQQNPPLYPFSSLWKVSDFRGGMDFGAHRLLLAGWSMQGDSRAWANMLSPLLLPGMLLIRRPWPRPVIVFGLLGLLASTLTGLTQARYQLPWLLGLLVWSALGWVQQGGDRKWLRGVFWSVALASTLIAVSPWWPKLVVAVGGMPVSSYLETRLTPWPAYQWLRGTAYSKVMLTDPRAYHCPKPFFLVDQGLLNDETYPGVIAYLESQDCDVVLWNFDSPRVARAALWQASALAQGNRDLMSQGLIGKLGPAWLAHQLDKWPAFGRPDIAPSDYDPISHKLRVLYFLCVHSEPVFQDGQVLITRWPRPGHW